jgi:hypothetical protein
MRDMGWKRRISGGILASIGFMLSPLSWWNDLVVNVPLALCFACVVGIFWPAAFTVSVIIGYWLTNVLGFVLLHKGAQQILAERKAYSWRELLKDALIAAGYTLLILALLSTGILKPISAYFHQGRSRGDGN